MSAIPPGWLASGIQSLDAQKRATQAKAAEAADEARRSGRDGFSDQLQNVIENSDRDGQVDADAQGTGSQGRASDAAPDEDLPPADSDAAGETDGGGLDIHA